jgi:hypothetical protein
MANKIQFRRGTKAQLTALGPLAAGEPGYTSDTKELVIGNATGANTPVVTATSADITYYVRTDGNDSNTGLANTAGGAFKTIGKAVSMIPQVVNHMMKILVAAGTYNEAVILEGKHGTGYVEIAGTSATVTNVSVGRCQRVVISGFTATSASVSGFNAYDGGFIDIRNCVSVVSSTSPGVYVGGQRADIRNCTFSNRAAGIYVENGNVTSIDNAGIGNAIGIYASHSGTINKYGTQPSGPAPEGVLNGFISAGVINPWGDNTFNNRPSTSVYLSPFTLTTACIQDAFSGERVGQS